MTPRPGPLQDTPAKGLAPRRIMAAIAMRCVRLGSGRGLWGLLDQAAVSLGNYLTGLVVLQALPMKEFGVFFILFGVMLFLNSLHAAVVTYPLSRRGAMADAGALRRRAGGAMAITLFLVLPQGLAILVICGLEQRQALAPFVLAALGLWQMQETLRRALMAHLRHREAVWGDALSYLGQAGAVFALAMSGALSLEAVFLVMCSTSLLALLLQARQLRPLQPALSWIVFLLGEEWPRSRWVLLTSAITLLTVQAVPWTLAATHGMEAVAEFGALAQIMGLTNPVLIGIAGLVLPATAAAAAQGVAAAVRIAWRHALPGVLFLLPFYMIVLSQPQLVLRLFTEHHGYLDLPMELRLYAAGFALVFPAHVMLALLNGLGFTRASFAVQGAYSMATMLVSLPSAIVFGLAGAVWAGLVPALVFLAAALIMLRRVAGQAVRSSRLGHGTCTAS